MNKKFSRKLKLDKEKLRNLTPKELASLVGGTSFGGSGYITQSARYGGRCDEHQTL
jgi:hypothetical protein